MAIRSSSCRRRWKAVRISCRCSALKVAMPHPPTRRLRFSLCGFLLDWIFPGYHNRFRERVAAPLAWPAGCWAATARLGGNRMAGARTPVMLKFDYTHASPGDGQAMAACPPSPFAGRRVHEEAEQREAATEP